MYQSNILVQFFRELATGLVDTVILPPLSTLTTFTLLVRVTQGALQLFS